MTTYREDRIVVAGLPIGAISVWLNRTMETLWLLTVVLVPLAFLNRDYIFSEAAIAFAEVPKIALLRTLVGLMTILWLVEWGLSGKFPFQGWLKSQGQALKPAIYLSRLAGWLREQPTRWLALAVWFFLVSTLVSTVFSASFNVSLWGETPGQDGLSAYTLGAYLLLFGVITTHLKTLPQFWRLMSAIVVGGVLAAAVSVLQHYGGDVFGALESSGGGQARVTSTMGNAVFAGAAMLIPIAISLMLATISLEKASVAGRRLRTPLMASQIPYIGGWVFILAIQLLGLIFTFSRGPWLGTLMALLSFLIATFFVVGWRTSARVAIVLSLASIFAFVALQWGDAAVATIAGNTASNSPSSQSDTGSDPFNTGNGSGPGAPDSAVSDVTRRATSISGEVASGGLSNRVNIWKGSLVLMRDHPWFEFDDLSLRWLRPLVGYGPDMFRYTYLLVSVPLDASLLPAEPDHAHNFFLNQGVEQGFLGLASSLGVFLAVFCVGGYLLIWKSSGYSPMHKLVLAGLVAAVAGRFLEQTVGLTRVSDLMQFWVILAAFAALPSVMEVHAQAPSPSPEPAVASGRSRRARASRSARNSNAMDLQVLLRLVFVAWAVGGMIALTWVKTINYPRAAVAASRALEQFNREDYQGALTSLEQATRLAPDVPIYHTSKASVFIAYLRNANVPRHPECSLGLNGTTYQDCLVQNVHFNHIIGAEQRPLYWRTQLVRANSALALGLNDEAIRSYRNVVALVPGGWLLYNRLAEAYIDIGQPESALEVLAESLALTKDSYLSDEALRLQATALSNIEAAQGPLTDGSHN